MKLTEAKPGMDAGLSAGTHQPQAPLDSTRRSKPAVDTLEKPRSGWTPMRVAKLATSSLALFSGVTQADARDARSSEVIAALPLPQTTPAARANPGRQLLLERPAQHLDRELVVGLQNADEDLTWLDTVDDSLHVTVYDATGGGGQWPQRPVSRVAINDNDVINLGETCYTVASHLYTYYDSVAQYTVFAPADATYHSPALAEGLHSVNPTQGVRAFSILTDENRPPKPFLRDCENGTVFRSERRSTRTLESVFYRDRNHELAADYRHYFELPEGSNIASHYFGSIGLPRWMPASADVMSAPHAGMVGVRSDKVRQHPRHIYEQMRLKVQESPVLCRVSEQTHLVLFGGPGFNDHTGLPRRPHVRPTAAQDEDKKAAEAA